MTQKFASIIVKSVFHCNRCLVHNFVSFVLLFVTTTFTSNFTTYSLSNCHTFHKKNLLPIYNEQQPTFGVCFNVCLYDVSHDRSVIQFGDCHFSSSGGCECYTSLSSMFLCLWVEVYFDNINFAITFAHFF